MTSTPSSSAFSSLHQVDATFRFARRMGCALLLAVGLAALAGHAAHAQEAPPIHVSNGIAYTSGGIGSDESTLMRSAMKNWPASLEFATKDGQRGGIL